MADYNPFQSVMQPNSRQSGLWDMRMMGTANRMETPFERGIRGAGRSGVSGNPMLASMASMSGEPDYSGFTYDPAMRAQAQSMGVQPLEANQVKQNVILPNTGFFGNHPRLSAAIEGGLLGAASTPGGGSMASTGENVGNVIEGAVGGQRVRQGMYRQQFARPFEARGMLEGMQDAQQRRELQEADIQHLRAENIKLGRPDHDFRAFGVSKNDPNIVTVDSTNGDVRVTPNPQYDPNAAGGTPPEDQFFAQKRAEYKSSGKPVTANDLSAWQKEWRDSSQVPEHAPHALVAVPDGKGGVIYQEARPGAHFASTPETLSQAGAAPGKAVAARQNWIKQQLAKPGPTWLAAGVSPGDPQAAQKLGNYYDQNLAQSDTGAPQGTQNNPHVIP
jgi:hypothetical protein